MRGSLVVTFAAIRLARSEAQHPARAEILNHIFASMCRGVNPGGWGVAPDFGHGGRSGSRGLVVKYYYILSCTGSMFESGDF